MELSLVALNAARIALWAVDKASGGALEKVGADVVDLLTQRFRGKLQIRGSQPEVLQATILSEAERDRQFRKNLEKLVNQYQEQYRIHQQNVQNNSVHQNTESGTNVNVGNNSGTVIGQQFFR